MVSILKRIVPSCEISCPKYGTSLYHTLAGFQIFSKGGRSLLSCIFLSGLETQATVLNDSLKTVEYDVKKIFGLSIKNWSLVDGFLGQMGRNRENRQKIHINTPIPPSSGWIGVNPI